MTCAEFLAWLDTGSAPAHQAAAHAHAVACMRCARGLAQARHLDELLAAPLPPARAGLAPEVMQRVRASGAPALQPAAWGIVPATSGWRAFLLEPAILFPGIAAGMALLFALLAVLPGTAARVRPGLVAFRHLSADGAHALSAMSSEPDAIPVMLLAGAALAGAAWFATRGTGLRAR